MNIVPVSASRSYEVKIGRGLLDRLGPELSAIAKGSVLLVTDENVAPLYLARAYRSLTEAGFAVFTLSLPAGEASKSPENFLRLLNVLWLLNFL